MNSKLQKFVDRLSKLEMKSKLAIAFSLVSVICIVSISSLSLYRSSNSLDSLAKAQLESMGDIMKQRIEAYYKETTQFTEKLGKDRLVEGLFLSYESAFYGGGFIPGFDENINGPGYEDLNSRYKERTDSILENFKFSNLLLITIDSQVVFSAKPDKKALVLGKNLENGDLKDTNLTSCFTKAKESDGKKAFFSDYQFNKILNTTVAYMCIKQYAEFDHLSEGIKKGDVMGIVVTQVDIPRINSIMTQRGGMGETGQAYLVGQDHKLRSDFFLERDKFNIDFSFKNNNLIKSSSIESALAGKTGSNIITGPTNDEVLSYYTSIDIFGENGLWYQSS